MNRKVMRWSTTFACLVLLAAGCTHRVWFTQSVRESYEAGSGAPPTRPGEVELSAKGPDNLQYFVSSRIVLWRELTSRQDKIAQGRIVVRKGRLVEQVIIRRGTPGVAVGWGTNWVAISFEKGTQLVFQRSTPDNADHKDNGARPNFFSGPLPSATYRLKTATNEQGRAIVLFENRHYFAIRNTGAARLKVRRKSRERRRRRRKVLRGRRI